MARKPANLYSGILASTPTLRQGHGSRKKDKCNNDACMQNRGKESHRLSEKEFNERCETRWREIMGQRV